MIDDKTFKKLMEEKLKEKFGNGIYLTWNDITRNNGKITTGIQIVREDNEVPIIINMDNFYQQYKLEALPISIIAEKICSANLQYEAAEESQIPNFLSLERIANQILYKLVNTELNEDLLSEIPHRRFGNLAVVYYILVREDEKERITVMINNEMMIQWGISEENLYDLAGKNTPLIQPIVFKKATDIIKEFAPETLFDIEKEPIFPLYWLSNRQNLFGATVLLYPDILKMLSAFLNSNLLILPSSIHEILIIPLNETADFEKFNKLVQEVNLLCVHKEEVLSDHVYYYQRESGKLSVE